MNNANRAEYQVRHAVLKLLSDEEVGRVSTAETAARLAEGEEYLDLDQLDQGVRRAHGTTVPVRRALPRKAVSEETWRKILEQLPPPVPMPTPSAD